MKPIFMDTVGLLALWDASDQWHAVAETAFRQAEAKQREFVSTTFVFLECGNAAARKSYRQRVSAVARELAADQALIRPSEIDWELAWSRYEQGHPGDAGIVDQVSFAVMRRLGIREVFTNDQHFAAAGFNTLF